MAILDELIEELSLLPEDRKRMQERGFSDQIIDAKKWRSCHPDNVRVLEALMIKYGDVAMTSLQLYLNNPRKQGEYYPNPQLLESNILIPYYGKDRELFKVRPHKQGFKGHGSMVYRPETSYKKSTVCIIAESEFKADAAEVYGYAAIGIPGISSMSGKNWDYFKGELETIETGEFIICFDNEIKDNKEFKNFKPDWRKRYDTIIYAYAMCQKILNAGLHCKIATLPAAWMVDGKIDIDGALAQHRTPYEFKDCIDAALAPGAFKKVAPIPEQHVRYFERRVRHFFFNALVELKSNCFFAKPTKALPEGRRLTNCSFYIKNVYEEVGTETNGIRRDLVIVDEYNIESRAMQITPTAMSSKGAFSTWLMAQGNFLFYGTDGDITHIWEYVFNNDQGDVVILMNRCGYIKELGFYLFKNVLIKEGVAYYPDENGICWMDDVGYKVNSLTDDDAVPALVTTPAAFQMEKFISLLSDTTDVERPGMAKALIAWVFAVLFLEAIQEKYHLFPLLFVYGNRGSGKTTIIRWLTSFFGQEGATKSLAASSSVGVSRLMSYYANIPLVVDDWRDDVKSNSFKTLFLGVYNRQSGAKGVKARFGLQQTDVRSALVILGEDLISDNGLQTRCLNFYMPMERKRECLPEIEELMPAASRFTFDLLTGDYAGMQTKVMKEIEAAINFISGHLPKVERRIVINYGILLGAYNAVMGLDMQLADYIIYRVSSGSKDLMSGDKLHKFAEEFSFGVTENILQAHHFQFASDGRVLSLWVKGICDVMNKFYSRYDRDTSRLIVQHFSQQPYFIRLHKVALKGSKGLLPVVELDVEKMPDSIRHHFEAIKESAA